MRRRAMQLAFAAAFVFPAGCNDKDDDGGSGPDAPPEEIVFEDRFSDEFPGSNWNVVEGFPFKDEDRGNPTPGVVVGLFNRGVFHSDFTFSTAEPVKVSFDLATPGVRTESDTRFRFHIFRDGSPTSDASFEVVLMDGELRLEILGETREFDAFTDAQFRTITFSVEQGEATWSIDGQPFLARGGFPEDQFRIEIDANGGLTTGFVVDNVVITRPIRGR